jgi:hypothetical protein
MFGWRAQHAAQLLNELGWELKQAPGFSVNNKIIYDFVVRGNGSIPGAVGRGVDPDPELAIIKSVIEAIERCIYLEKAQPGSTGNGWAVHLKESLAKLKALSELLERDAFFCHFITEQPFEEMADHGYDINSIALRMFKMETPWGHSRLAYAEHPNGSFKIGFGFSHESAKAAEWASLAETCRSQAHREKITTAEFYTKHRADPASHGRLLQNAEYRKWFEQTYFDTKPSPGWRKSHLGEPSWNEIWQTTNFFMHSSLLTQKFGVVCIQAENHHLQQIWFGAMAANYIHPKLKPLCKYLQSSGDIMAMPPHPFD